ncbi:MAG: hypothetical protein R6V67_00360 [Spirochaetia bacterium]
MRRYSVFILVLIFLPLLQTGLFSFEWPVTPVRVLTTFGEYRNGSFFKGLEIDAQEGEIRAIESGKIIFIAEESPPHNGALPSGLGNSVVVEHERGIRSVYGYLTGTPEGTDNREVGKDEVLPLSGGSSSGRTLSDGREGEENSREGEENRVFYLKILDSEVEQAVNPLLSLPSVDDTQDVGIEAVELVSTGNPEKASVPLGEKSSVEAGEYEIHIEAYDYYDSEDRTFPTAPFSFSIYINGEEEFNIRFESITAEELSHTLVGTGGKSASDLYKDKRRFCPGTLQLNPGEAIIEVVVSDIAGNETAETYRLNVQ